MEFKGVARLSVTVKVEAEASDTGMELAQRRIRLVLVKLQDLAHAEGIVIYDIEVPRVGCFEDMKC